MPIAAHRWGDYVMFDGQSLNDAPTQPNSYPVQMMASYPSVGYSVIAQGGYPWTFLTDDETHQATLAAMARASRNPIWIGLGGQSDVAGVDPGIQAPADAATIYARMVSYAQRMTAFGYAQVFMCTIPAAPSLYDAAMDTQRLAANALILANADGAFDQAIDIGDPALGGDGIHFSNAGALEVVAIVDPLLAAVLT